MYEREGIELDRSTLADWVGGASSVLAPLVEALRRYVLATSKLHGGDTPMPVLAPGNGRTKTARLWTYVRDDRPAGDMAAPAVWFAYSPDRKGDHSQQHMKGFCGTLHADGRAGFNRLYEEGRVREAGCWAHVRRKFYCLEQAHASPVAAEALARIGQLYSIEREIRGPGRRSISCISSWKKRAPNSRANPTSPRRSTMRGGAGVCSRAIAMTVPSRLTITPRNALCAW